MFLALEMPPIYRLYQPPINSYAPWIKWGWCDARQMTDVVNTAYNLEWTTYDLIARFGVEQMAASRIHSFELSLLISYRFFFNHLPYTRKLIDSLKRDNERFFVPAGWAKKVCWALALDGRRLEIKEEKLVICNVHGEEICSL